MSYGLICRFYDEINGPYYKPYAEFLHRAFGFCEIPIGRVADIGCGTGAVTRLMAKSYNMMGVDISVDMLSVAASCGDAGGRIIYINQDMKKLNLGGEITAAYCSFDVVNHLANEKEFGCFLSALHSTLETGGIFAFDINTPFRYKRVYAKNDFVFEMGNDMLVWQSYFDEESGDCEFALSLFKSNNGVYTRENESIYEHCFEAKTVKKLLSEAGFEIIGCYGTPELLPAAKSSEKLYFIVIKR